jgi:hypothetical protein
MYERTGMFTRALGFGSDYTSTGVVLSPGDNYDIVDIGSLPYLKSKIGRSKDDDEPMILNAIVTAPCRATYEPDVATVVKRKLGIYSWIIAVALLLAALSVAGVVTVE